MTTDQETDTRLAMFDEIVNGVRAVRSFLVDHPELPTPSVDSRGNRVQFSIMVTDLTCDDPVASFKLYVRNLMDGAPVGTITKRYVDSEKSYSHVTRSFGVVDLDVWTFRETVCTRTLVGSKVVPIYEFECGPILGSVPA